MLLLRPNSLLERFVWLRTGLYYLRRVSPFNEMHAYAIAFVASLNYIALVKRCFGCRKVILRHCRFVSNVSST